MNISRISRSSRLYLSRGLIDQINEIDEINQINQINEINQIDQIHKMSYNMSTLEEGSLHYGGYINGRHCSELIN